MLLSFAEFKDIQKYQLNMTQSCKHTSLSHTTNYLVTCGIYISIRLEILVDTCSHDSNGTAVP